MIDLKIKYLKSVIISQLLIESNESLKGTTVYKHSLKSAVNKCNRECEAAYNKHYDSVYQNDPETTTNVLNKIESVVDKISSASIDELVMIDAVINKYIENKEWFKNNAEAEFLKLD